MVATEERPVLLKPVSDDPDAADLARRRHRLNGAFEAVERMGFPVLDDLEGLVVFVAAGFTARHGRTSSVAVEIRGSKRRSRFGSRAARAPSNPFDSKVRIGGCRKRANVGI